MISIPEPFMPLGEFPYFELREIEELNAAALDDAKRYAETGAEMLSKAGLNSHSGNTTSKRQRRQRNCQGGGAMAGATCGSWLAWPSRI